MPEIEVAFAPTRVGGRRRHIPPGVVGLVLVALVVLALLKPWGADSGRAGPSASAPGGSHVGLAAASASAVAPTSSQDAGPTPVTVLAGPPRLGTWGVAFAADAVPAAGRAPDWTGWTALAPVSDRPDPPIRDPQPLGTGCADVPTVDESPTIVALTVPDAVPADFGIRGWWSGSGVTRSLDGLLGRLDMPGLTPTAELARTDGWQWPAGRYEFHILTQGHVTALGFCLAPPPAPASSVAGATTIDLIVHDLSARSGAWGIGDGGDGPRLVRDEPWNDWAAVDPGPAWGGSSLTLWPDTGLCMSAPILLSEPVLVAVTVPAGLAPDWTVASWGQDGTGIRSLAGDVRQVAPPGNRGITYLERIDKAPWPAGRYEFDVQTGDHRISMTVCLGGS